MNRKVLYCRISTLDQSTDRQRVREKEYDLVIEDKISGSVPFFVRPGGQEIFKLTEIGVVSEITVVSIDRLGRSLIDVLNTINFFTKRRIAVQIMSPQLRTLQPDGSEDQIASLVINMLGIVGQIELKNIRERQKQGVQLAKLKGVYKGRAAGSDETTLQFLSKAKNSKALDMLRRGLRGNEVAKLTGLNINTVTKIKKLGLPGKISALTTS